MFIINMVSNSIDYIIMNKSRQKLLTKWLNTEGSLVQRWLQLSILLGLINGILIIVQTWLLAALLHAFMIAHTPRKQMLSSFAWLAITFALRALLRWLREHVGFICGKIIRKHIRQKVLDKLQQLSPVWIQTKPAGNWASIIIEQIENIQNYYARYLPQLTLAVLIPLLVLITVFSINWAAGAILLISAPLIPLLMVLVGKGAADASRRNFLSLERLSGNFLDHLRGMDHFRLFNRAVAETAQISKSSESLRSCIMEVLRLAFFSSAVLEFFASLSIAILAIYFSYSYLGKLDFGSYSLGVTLFSGILILVLAPECFQPLRELGSFYHVKAQAIGAAEALEAFLCDDNEQIIGRKKTLEKDTPMVMHARDLEILSPNGVPLTATLRFTLYTGQRVALVGLSGAGKSSLLNLLLGFLPYRGSITVNGIELRELSRKNWHQQVSWIGQNPHLPEQTLRANILLGNPKASAEELLKAIELSCVSEFLPFLPQGIETEIGDNAFRLSVGQAQRVAVARALISPRRLLLLDEPTASLDLRTEQQVMQALHTASRQQIILLVTHQLADTKDYDQIWVMNNGRIVQKGDYVTLRSQPGLFAKLNACRFEWL